MTSNRTRYVLVLLTTAVLLISACGADESAPTQNLSGGPNDTDSDDADPGVADTDEASETSDPASSDPASSEFQRDDYVATMTDAMASEDDLEFGGDGVACIAEALVDVVGVERLGAEGISPEQFAAADSIAELGLDVDGSGVDRLAQAMDDCVDLREVLASGAPDGFACLVENLDESEFARAFAAELATGTSSDPAMLMFESADPACAEQVFLATGVERGDITEEQSRCLADVLDDEAALRIMVASATSEGPAQADGQILGNAFVECGVQP